MRTRKITFSQKHLSKRLQMFLEEQPNITLVLVATKDRSYWKDQRENEIAKLLSNKRTQ